MLFTLEVTIPANTTEAAPSTETLKLAAGVITGISVKFPSGCHGLVGVRLKHEEAQLTPVGRSSWVSGDGETVLSPEYYDLGKSAKELEFVGVSPGTTYPHTITVRVTVLPKEVATVLPLIEVLTRFLQRIGVIG